MTELTETDLPVHPDPHAWTWTDAEKRAILRWGKELLATRATPAPGAPGQEAADAKDAARYREFFASGLPITFLGVEYRTKAELDAAIDAVQQEGQST